MKCKRKKRAGYYKYYERADIKDYRLVWDITKGVVKEEGVPFSFNKRGRKPNLDAEEYVCVSVLYVYFNDPFRGTERLLRLLSGKQLNHSNIIRWFGKLDERYIDRIAYKVHCKIIEINDRGDYIADSSGVTCDRYKSGTRRGEEFSEHTTCKLHILGQYLFMIGLVSIVSVCASRGEANDYPYFKKLFRANRIKSGKECHADKAYFGKENIRLCKKAKVKPNFVPKNREYSDATLKRAVREYDNEARKKNRGLIETPFGGLETEMGMRTRCRKPKHRRIFICLLALKHNIKTLIRAKALILLHYFRTNLALSERYINILL